MPALNNLQQGAIMRRLQSSGPVTVRLEGGTDLTGTANTNGSEWCITLTTTDSKVWTIPFSSIVAAAAAS